MSTVPACFEPSYRPATGAFPHREPVVHNPDHHLRRSPQRYAPLLPCGYLTSRRRPRTDRLGHRSGARRRSAHCAARLLSGFRHAAERGCGKPYCARVTQTVWLPPSVAPAPVRDSPTTSPTDRRTAGATAANRHGGVTAYQTAVRTSGPDP